MSHCKVCASPFQFEDCAKTQLRLAALLAARETIGFRRECASFPVNRFILEHRGCFPLGSPQQAHALQGVESRDLTVSQCRTRI